MNYELVAGSGSYAPQRGELAQLARAPALHAGGQRFESVILHIEEEDRLKANPSAAQPRLPARSLTFWNRKRKNEDSIS